MGRVHVCVCVDVGVSVGGAGTASVQGVFLWFFCLEA